MRRTITTFKPEYSLIQKVGLFFSPLIVAIVVFAALAGGREQPLLYLGLLFPFAYIMLPFAIVRQIRFDEKFFVDRFIVPSLELDYTDIVDVGISGFKTKKRSFSLAGAKNADDFRGMLAYAMEKRNISQSQIKGKLAKQEVVAWKTVAFSQLAAIPITLALAFFVPSLFSVFGELTFVVVFAAVSFPNGPDTFRFIRV